MRRRIGIVHSLLWAAAVLLLPLSTSRADPYLDPLGDTFGGGPVQLDISSIDVTRIGDDFQLDVNFTGPIAPPSAFAPNSVVGLLDLDTDLNPATGGDAPWGGPVPGGNSWINFFVDVGLIPGPLTALGDELYVNLFSELFNPGFVDVLDTATNSVQASIPITYGPTSFSFVLPGSVLGSRNFNFGLLIGTFSEPTDRAANGAVPFTTIPEPSSVVMLLLGSASLAGGVARRRWQSKKATTI